MKQPFRMKTVRTLWLLLLAWWVFPAQADEGNGPADRYRYAIEGVVVDESGTPLPGASVKITGTTFGAGTNTQGEFVLRVEDTAKRTLRVSFVGYDPVDVEAVPAESWADWRFSRAFSIWSRMVSDSTVHSTSPLETVLPASLVKPFTVPEPEA